MRERRRWLPRVLPLLAIVVLAALGGCGTPKPEEVRIVPGERTLTVGGDATFEAIGLSGSGKEVADLLFEWKVLGDAGSVDDGGHFVAVRPGDATIVAETGGVSGKARVRVIPRPVSKLSLAPDATRLLAGSTVRVRITALSSDDQPAGFNEVLLSSESETLSFSPGTLVLDAAGEGEFVLSLPRIPGEYSVAARCGGVADSITIEGTAIAGLKILPEQNTYEAGQTVVFSAVVVDEYGYSRPVDAAWSLAGTQAVLGEGGAVFMKEPGETLLSARYEQIRQDLSITIEVGALSRIILEPTGVEMKAGEQVGFKATGVNVHEQSVPVEPDWSVVGDVGTITADGTFVAVKTGTGAVRAEAGGVFSDAAVEVEPGPLVDIELAVSRRQLVAGETMALSAQGVDGLGNRFPVSPLWSLIGSTGEIDQEGAMFTALHAGHGQIRAQVGGTVRGVSIEVLPAELSEIRFADQDIEVRAGETVQLEVIGLDRFGNTVPVTPEFSLKEELGELSQEGAFSARKAGDTVIRASAGEFAADAVLTVTAGPMKAATIEPAGPLKMKAGQVQAFRASGVDALGNTVDALLHWSVAPPLGTLDEGGVFRAERAGEGRISVAVAQKGTDAILDAHVDVTVAPAETAVIEIVPSRLKIMAGESMQFAATPRDAFGNETAGRVTWGLEGPSLGTISDDGFFTARGAGKGEVIAVRDGVTGRVPLEVTPARIVSLRIVPDSLSVRSGQEVRLRAEGEDMFGNAIQPDVLWRLSDPDLGLIGPDGILTAAREGKGWVLAASGDIAAMVPLEVQRGGLVSISVEPACAELAVGESLAFRATGFDAGGNVVPLDPAWTADTALGKVSSAGVFQAGTPGEGVVTAASGAFRATARIVVIPGEPSTLTIEPDILEIAAGDLVPLKLQVYDAQGYPVPDAPYEWEVANGLGRVTPELEFRAVKAGEGVLRITAGTAAGAVRVTVRPGPIHRIEVSPSDLAVASGEEVIFSAGAFDAEGNEVAFEPDWSTGGGIGPVNGQGIFRAETAGPGFVAARSGRVSGIARITVVPGPVDRIAVTPARIELTAGASVAFYAAAYDAFGNVVPVDFTWSLEGDGPPLGALTTDGRFRAVRSGTCEVAATAGAVRGASLVTVVPGEIAGLEVSPGEIELSAGDRTQVSVRAADRYGNPVAVSPVMRVVPEDLGVIGPDGLFTAGGSGEGRIVVRCGERETSVPVRVRAGELRSIVIEPPSGVIVVGGTYELRAIGYDAGGNEVPVEPAWAVTRDIGSIDPSTGVFSAGKAGSGAVMAYSGSVEATALLQVESGGSNVDLPCDPAAGGTVAPGTGEGNLP